MAPNNNEETTKTAPWKYPAKQGTENVNRTGGICKEASRKRVTISGGICKESGHY